jgi:hypothetical protein
MSTVGAPIAVPAPIATEPDFSTKKKFNAAGFHAWNWLA